MHSGTWLVLVGLGVELLGALLLSVEAIGIDKVHSAITRVTSFRDFITSEHPTNTFLSPVRFYIAIVGPLGGMLVVYFAFELYPSFSGLSYLLAVIAGGLVCLFLVVGIVFMLTLFARFLEYSEASTRNRTAGVAGFSILAVGITLQFTGTIMDGLMRH
jgi:hypothetical protein